MHSEKVVKWSYLYTYIWYICIIMYNGCNVYFSIIGSLDIIGYNMYIYICIIPQYFYPWIHIYYLLSVIYYLLSTIYYLLIIYYLLTMWDMYIYIYDIYLNPQAVQFQRDASATPRRFTPRWVLSGLRRWRTCSWRLRRPQKGNLKLLYLNGLVKGKILTGNHGFCQQFAGGFLQIFP